MALPDPADPLAPVRTRPAMWIGTTDTPGLTQLVSEALGWAVDEHLAGFARRVDVRIHGAEIELEDDGRGVPGEGAGGGPTLDQLVTTLGPLAGTAMLRGAGFALANALSERFEIESRHDGVAWGATFSRGQVVVPVHVLGQTTARGLRVRFRPDQQTFAAPIVDESALEARIEQLAWLTPRLAWFLQGRSKQRADGLEGLVVANAPTPLLPGTLFAVAGEAQGVQLHAAVGLASGRRGKRVGFVNFARVDGGAHVRGVARGARRAFPGAPTSLERRLVTAVHVGLPAPHFVGTVRRQLSDDTVEQVVLKHVELALRDQDDLRISWLQALT
ncbi:MAG: hypothetical protein JNJ54_06635 [Myxococcaceae bacterium]|nr:hypothetical protein [Myxococcaceae bacterium]